MNDIVKKAEELGSLIAASDRFAALQNARDAAEADAALKADLTALQAQARKIAELERQVKPVEVEDKHRLRDLQQKATANPLMRQLARAEADFAELMNRVNRAIQQKLPARPTKAPKT